VEKNEREEYVNFGKNERDPCENPPVTPGTTLEKSKKELKKKYVDVSGS
jgi:hypothetical protein